MQRPPHRICSSVGSHLSSVIRIRQPAESAFRRAALLNDSITPISHLLLPLFNWN